MVTEKRRLWQCGATISFADGLGDHTCIFSCELAKKSHGEWHRFKGRMYGQDYDFKWRGEREPDLDC